MCDIDGNGVETCLSCADNYVVKGAVGSCDGKCLHIHC